MKFEQLIPFIILLLMWGAGRILQKKGKPDQKKQAPASQQPGFFKMLQQQLADLEEEDEDEEIEYFQPPYQTLPAELDKETLIELAEESLQQKPATTGMETVSVEPPTWIAKTRPAKTRSAILQKKPCRQVGHRRKLQNAIIWAEILAPPVALRK